MECSGCTGLILFRAARYLTPSAPRVCQNLEQITESHVKTSNALLGLALFLGGTGACALSLGDARGTVVLGRPLDVVFDVYPDAGVPLDDRCLTASATAGDTRIDSSRMQITVLPAAAGRAQAVRVRSRELVNEPILTVQLSAGCGAQVSRTYHLFADPPPTAVAAALPVLPPAKGPASAALEGAAVTEPRARVAAVQPRRAPEAAVRVAPAAPKRPARSRPAPASALTAAAPASRLVVEPLEDWLLAPPALRMSGELQALPAQAPSPERAQAAAQWQVLNGSADDSAAQAEHARLLTGQTAAARAQAAQATAALQTLQQRLDRLEAERFSPALLYALLALWMATLAGWLWYALRARRQAADAASSWSSAVAGSAAHEVFADDEALPTRSGHAGGPPGLQERDLDIFLSDDMPPPRKAPWAQRTEAAPLVPIAPVVPIPPAPVPLPVAASVVPPAAAAPALHVVQPEDLFDLQQQAEFFISVGEHDQAIAVMTRHINENHAASPWAYLELLPLDRSLSRVGPFNQLREQFQQHFNAQVPVFAAFHHVNRVLLDYPEVLAGVEALWSDNAVLPLLERLLFCGKATAPMERFDLSAYDDLLMLYAIASTTQASARGLPPPRPRTTPVADAEQPASLVPPARLDLEELDSLIPSPPPEPSPSFMQTNNMIEYDDLQVSQHGTPPEVVLPDQELDIDLSEPDWTDSLRLPALTLSDLPAMPVTAAPASGQPVGFGANSDRVEARFDLEERKP